MSEDSKSLESANVLHIKNVSELNLIFDNILKNASDNETDEFSEQNKMILDTVGLIKKQFNEDYLVKFDLAGGKKKNALDPSYYEMYLKLAVPDTVGGKHIKIFSQNELSVNLKDEIDSLAVYLKQENSRFISSVLNCEKISSEIDASVEQSAQDVFETKTNETFIFILIIAVLSVSVALFISRQIVNPIITLQDYIDQITKGELPESIKIKSKDEIGDIGLSVNTLVEGLTKTAAFSIEIGKGNFSTQYKPLGSKDILGNSLLTMRDSLKTAFEEDEKRKIEDAQRNRTSEGLALFGEILRHNTENITELSNEIISNLVKFLNANQGGIFILNDSDKSNIHLDLLGAYAYNRKKYLNKTVRPGEGLIGAVALEKYTIYLTEIPDEYIEIESGTGSANPKSLLIVPLKIENNILGILELASFNDFEKYEIDLVEKIAESIASTLSTARINTRTAELLEQSNKQAAQMREQEDEMLRNYTNLKSILEETEKREAHLKETLQNLEKTYKILEDREHEFEREIKYLNDENKDKVKKILEDEVFIKNIIDSDINSLIVADEDLKIKFFNKSAQKLFGYNYTEIIGRNLNIIFTEETNKKYTGKTGQFSLRGSDLIGKEIELPVLKKDKTKQIVLFSLTYSGHENKMQYLVFIKDISREQELEKERTLIFESLMAKEFEYEVKIERLEKALADSKIDLPDETETYEIIRWSNAFSINLNIIDQQHKKWIEIINNFYREFKKGNANTELSKYFKELTDYTDYHFSFEEKYMADFKYEEFEDHKQKHADFLDRIRTYRAEYDEGKQDVAYRLMGFLRKWVRIHISEDDFSYSALFRKNGLT
jgi:hemerythrin-like metal-binding protein/PAS domain S-box-containing protein